MKIEEYYIVTEGSTQSLQKEVNRLIKMGYQPFGQFSFHEIAAPAAKGKPVFWQPMVKYTN